MTANDNVQSQYHGFGLERLMALPTVPALEFQNWGSEEVELASTPAQPSGPFASETEFRFCKAVIENPMLACSAYPKLAGISSKTAVLVRRSLVDKGFVHEHILDSGKRGPSSLLLEATPEGIAAVKKYESLMGRNKS